MQHTTIRLVRHAEGEHMATPGIVAGRSPHAQLTDLGRQQAAARGTSWLQEGFQPNLVETSPILRCSETARLVLAAAGLRHEPILRDELGEMCQGGLEGTVRTPALVAQMEREGGAFRAPGHNSEGLPGESFGDVFDRWRRYLNSHVRQAPSEQPLLIAAFTHRVAIGTLISGLLIEQEYGPEAVTADSVRSRYMLERERLPVPPTSETQITLEPLSAGGFTTHIDYIGRSTDVD